MFTNEIVSENCNCKVEKDRTIHVPGIYSGLLSKITPKAAARMIKTKSNLIKLKEGKTLPEPEEKKEEAVKQDIETPAADDTAIADNSAGGGSRKRRKSEEDQ